MEPRKKIEITSTVMDVLLLMSEGNPGAASVLSTFLKEPMEGFGVVLDLDDMNIRGSQIWVGYKDYCGQDIEKFKKLAHERDKKMVAHINREGVRGNHKWKAVAHGASWGKRELLDGTNL